MERSRRIFAGAAILVLLILLGVLYYNQKYPDGVPAQQASTSPGSVPCPSNAYLALLGQFSEDYPGMGRDPSFAGVSDQPMTYGLVLSAEARHLMACPNIESGRRVRKAVHWLLDNADADGDGLVGWGLPEAWDAFSDGSTNPENHPYTITTAIIFEGLLDALSIPAYWTDSERDAIRRVLVKVSLRWCRNVWTGDASTGFFWYSPSRSDAYFLPNVSAMFLGSLARFAFTQADAFSKADLQFVRDRADAAARGILSKVTVRNGMPFWNYIAQPNVFNQAEPNDSVHHVYIVWGMEWYRHSGGGVVLPWSLDQATASVESFMRDGTIHEFPQDVSYKGAQEANQDRLAQLWGAGMVLAFESKWGKPAIAAHYLDSIVKTYGPLPAVRYLPLTMSKDEVFYPRYAAHLLFGIAQRDF